MDLGDALTLLALIGGAGGTVLCIGVFVGQLKSTIKELTHAIKGLSAEVESLRSDFRELRTEHNTLKEEVAEIKGRRYGRDK